MVKQRDEETPPATSAPFNYFNYFTEVEEEFVRRRGKPMFISPLDWALVESWKNAGIPLHIVLRAINDAFDAYEARPHRFRKVNSMFYCVQAVETQFAEYRLSQVGAPTPTTTATAEALSPASAQTTVEAPASAFAKATLLEFIRSSERELLAAEQRASAQNRQEVTGAITRARQRLLEIGKEIESAAQVSDEALERDFDAIDRLLVKTIMASLDDAQLARFRAEAEAQLKPYKKKIDEKLYNRTVENFVARRLRETHLIPRLSLFYI